MVETLVFETPTPLPEHAEREFGFPSDVPAAGGCPVHRPTAAHHQQAGLCNSSSSCLDDSGIELQQEE